MTRPIILTTLLLCAATTLAQALAPGAPSPGTQQPSAPRRPGDTADTQGRFDTISGRVTAADTGLPLARVQMRIIGAGLDSTTATDEQGRYAFGGVPRGIYRALASRSGYVTMFYGQRGQEDVVPNVRVAGDRANDRIDFALSKSGTILVEVLDEYGEPAESMSVQAFRYQSVNGEPRLTRVVSAERLMTDDHGISRLFGLPPGEFLVAASMEQQVRRGSTRAMYERTFYPGTLDERQAQPVSVAAGQEARVSFSMPPPVPAPAYVIVRGFDTPPPDPAVPAPAAGAGAISGTVTADSGLPLAHAQVTLVGSTERVAIADAGGRYAFATLPAGRYTLNASKTGYLMLQYGRRRIRQPSRTIELTNGQQFDGADFRLPQAGGIEALVTNEIGEPLPGVRVNTRQYRFIDGARRLVPAWQSVGGNLSEVPAPLTDDIGQVRISGLAPGEYFVQAETNGMLPYVRPGFVQIEGRATLSAAPPSTGHEGTVFTSTYFPGTPYVTDAVPIALKVGEEARVAVPLVATRAGSITGVITTDDGSPPAGLRLTLDQRPVPLLADGTYLVERVAGGEHVLDVAPAIVLGPRQYARRSFRTTGDDARIDITTSSGWTLRGRIEFEGDVPPGPPQVAFPLENHPLHLEDPTPGRMKLSANWTFEYTGLTGPRILGLFLLARRPGVPAELDYDGWWLKAVMIGDEDVTDKPIDPGDRREINDLRLVLSRDKRASVKGDVVDDQDRPVTDYSVVFFPEDPTLWTLASRRVVTARPDQGGRFDAQKLPPGRYLAAATDTLDAGEERDPALLTRLKDVATLVTLAEGDAATLRLRMLEP